MLAQLNLLVNLQRQTLILGLPTQTNFLQGLSRGSVHGKQISNKDVRVAYISTKL